MSDIGDSREYESSDHEDDEITDATMEGCPPSLTRTVSSFNPQRIWPGSGVSREESKLVRSMDAYGPQPERIMAGRASPSEGALACEGNNMSYFPMNSEMDVHEGSSDQSRSSSANSTESAVPTAENMIDWGIYRKLVDQAQRQCGPTSTRWANLVLPNNTLIMTVDRMTELVNQGLDLTNEDVHAQVVGLLQQVLWPVIRRVFVDDIVIHSLAEIMSCAYRFLTLFIAKLRTCPATKDIEPEYWLIMRVIFDPKCRFHHKFSTKDGSSFSHVVPGDLDLSVTHEVCRPMTSCFCYQSLITWFTQNEGFSLFLSFIANRIQMDSPLINVQLYTEWTCGLWEFLLEPVLNRYYSVFMNKIYRILIERENKAFECEKLKGDVRESPHNRLYQLVKYFLPICPSAFPYPDAAVLLDFFKLRFLKTVIVESPFNTRMSALDELHRFLRERDPHARMSLKTEQLELWIEDSQLVEALYKDNLHHVAYIDRLERVMAQLFDSNLLLDSVLNIIWNAQKGKHDAIRRNVHQLTAKLASHFSPNISEAFFAKLGASWIDGDVKERFEIIDLMRRVGFDLYKSEIVVKVIDFLWDRGRSESIQETPELQEKITNVIYEVLSDVFTSEHGQTVVVPGYIARCGQDVARLDESPRSRVNVVHSLVLLERLLNLYPDKFDDKGPECISPMTERYPKYFRSNMVKLLEKSVSECVYAVGLETFCGVVVKDIALFMMELESESLPSTSQSSPMPNPDDSSECTLVSEEVEERLRVRLDFLKFYVSEGYTFYEDGCDLFKDTDWAHSLWKSVVQSRFRNLRDLGFQFYRHMTVYEDMICSEPQSLFNFFDENVLRVPVESLSGNGFHCFESFLRRVNIVSDILQPKTLNENLSMEDSERFCWLMRPDVKGEAYLWEVIVKGQDVVFPLASSLLVNLWSSPSIEMNLSTTPPTYPEIIVNKCMTRLQTQEDLRRKTAPNSTERQHECSRIRRILQFMIELVEMNERTYRISRRERPPLRRAVMGRGFTINIQFRQDDMQLLHNSSPVPIQVEVPHQVKVHDNMLLVDLIEKICDHITNQGGTIHPYALSLLKRQSAGTGMSSSRFGVSEWGQTLRELGFDTMTHLIAKPEKTRLGSDGSNDQQFVLQSSTSECRRRELRLFSVILAARTENMELLVDMAEDPHLTEQCLQLLSSIPALNMFTQTERSFDEARETLTGLLSNIAAESSSARQVYSLMVLQAMVLPASLSSARTFDNQLLFISAGGLRLCLQLLSNKKMTSGLLQAISSHVLLRILPFCILMVAQIALKSDFPQSQLLLDLVHNVPRQCDGCMKEIVVRMTSSLCKGLSTTEVEQFIQQMAVEPGELTELLSLVSSTAQESSRSLYVAVVMESSIDTDVSVDYDEGDLMIVGYVQVLAFLCAFNQESACSLLLSEDWYTFLFDMVLDDRSLVAVWTAEIVSILLVAFSRELPGSGVFDGTVDRMFDNLHLADSPCFWDLLHRLVDSRIRFGQKLRKLEERLDATIFWLEEAQKLSQNQQCHFPDEVSLCGRLRLCKLLIEQLNSNQKETIGVKEGGPRLVERIINLFILPSSRAFSLQEHGDKADGCVPRSQTADEMHTASSSSMFDLHANSAIPRSLSASPLPHRSVAVCGMEESQPAAYDVLVALCAQCEPCLRMVKDMLLDMFYKNRSFNRMNWEYQPDHCLREPGNYVGLKNGGATCYMNSLLQQMFMLPQLRKAIMAVDPGYCAASSPSMDGKPDGSPSVEYPVKVLSAIQSVFAHLLGYELDAYTPSEFWNTFRLNGDSIHVNEQQDALEFYNSVVDVVDEGMKKIGCGKVCENTFGGLFADEKICKDCPHKYTREEPFTSISIDVRSHNNLTASLREYVKGDVLENDNAYHCEKCDKKVRAVKRLSIQRLPPVLVVQLKRFEFDWEKEQPVKYNDYFEFPFDLDMQPYTAEALSKADLQDICGETIEDEKKLEQNGEECQYSLRGVVVHSGQATGGHYYSYIKSTEDNMWYKFDDTDVTRYECQEADVRNKWFGGDTVDDFNRKRRQRSWWNAYLLFYEKVIPPSPNAESPPIPVPVVCPSQEPGLPVTSQLTVDACQPTLSSLLLSSSRRSSTASPVTKLHKHFSTMSLSSRMSQMPPRLEIMVRNQNTRIMHERNQYNINFFSFMKDLIWRTIALKDKSGLDIRSHQHAIELFSNFLVYTCLHSSVDLRSHRNLDRNVWSSLMERLLQVRQCRLWFVTNIMFNTHITNLYLLEARECDVRATYARIMHFVLAYSFDGGDTMDDLRQYSTVHLQSVLATLPHRSSIGDKHLSVEIMLESLQVLMRKDRDRRSVEVFSIVTLFATNPPDDRLDLLCIMARSGILTLLLCMLDGCYAQCLMNTLPSYLNYCRLIVLLVRVVDWRPWLEETLRETDITDRAPFLGLGDCPYLLVAPRRAVPFKEVRNCQEVTGWLLSQRRLETFISQLVQQCHCVGSLPDLFPRDSLLFLCWNNRLIGAKVYEFMLRAIMDERHPEVTQTVLFALLADLMSMNDQLRQSGEWFHWLFVGVELPYLDSRGYRLSGETGLRALCSDYSKTRQESLLRVLVLLLEQYEDVAVTLLEQYDCLHHLTEIYTTFVTRFNFVPTETDAGVWNIVPSRRDVVPRLCKFMQLVQVGSEENISGSSDSEGPLDLSVSARSSVSTGTQSGEKRPFPQDDDSPSLMTDSKKFNDGSEVPRVADVEDSDLLLATSRSVKEQKALNAAAPPPAYATPPPPYE